MTELIKDELIYDFQNQIAKQPVATMLYGYYNYSDYTTKTLTLGNIQSDEYFNEVIQQAEGNPTTNIDFLNGIQWMINYYYDIILNSTFYQIPFYNIVFQPQMAYQYTSNYAVRVHVFSGEDIDSTPPVFSIVNVEDGQEHYRLVWPAPYTPITDDNNPNFARNIKKVVNGAINNNAEITFSDMIIINSCIPLTIQDYVPFDTLMAALKGANPYAPENSDALTTFLSQASAFPFSDGLNGNIVMTNLRLIAMNQPTTEKNYILFPWLPWNDTTYNIFDCQKMQYVGASPFTWSNLTTIIKMLGIGILIYELIHLLRNGKLKNIFEELKLKF